VDAVDGADIDAREVFDVDAGLGDDVGHRQPVSLVKAFACDVVKKSRGGFADAAAKPVRRASDRW